MRRAILSLLAFAVAIVFLAVTRQANVLEQPQPPRGRQPLLSATDVPPLPTATATATRQPTATPTVTPSASSTDQPRAFAARTGTPSARPPVTFVPGSGTPGRIQVTPGVRPPSLTPQATPTMARDPILAGMLSALRAARSVSFTETFTEQAPPNASATPVPISENTVEIMMGPPVDVRFVSRVSGVESEIIIYGKTMYTRNGARWTERTLNDVELEDAIDLYARGSVCGQIVQARIWEMVPILPRRALETLNGERTIVFGLDEIRLNVYEQFNLWLSLDDFLPRKLVQPNPSRVVCTYSDWNRITVLPPP